MRYPLVLAALLLITHAATAADPNSATRASTIQPQKMRYQIIAFTLQLVDVEQPLRENPTLANQLRLAWHRCTRLPRQTVALSLLGPIVGPVQSDALWGLPQRDQLLTGWLKEWRLYVLSANPLRAKGFWYCRSTQIGGCSFPPRSLGAFKP